MEKCRLGTVFSRRCTRVDFPEPEGAEMINTLIIPVRSLSFKIESLFADFFDSGLGGKSQLCNAQAQITQPAGLRQDGVGLAVQLLQQKVEALAHFAAGIENFVQLAGVNLQTGNFLADI